MQSLHSAIRIFNERAGTHLSGQGIEYYLRRACDVAGMSWGEDFRKVGRFVAPDTAHPPHHPQTPPNPTTTHQATRRRPTTGRPTTGRPPAAQPTAGRPPAGHLAAERKAGARHRTGTTTRKTQTKRRAGGTAGRRRHTRRRGHAGHRGRQRQGDPRASASSRRTIQQRRTRLRRAARPDPPIPRQLNPHTGPNSQLAGLVGRSGCE